MRYFYNKNNQKSLGRCCHRVVKWRDVAFDLTRSGFWRKLVWILALSFPLDIPVGVSSLTATSTSVLIRRIDSNSPRLRSLNSVSEPRQPHSAPSSRERLLSAQPSPAPRLRVLQHCAEDRLIQFAPTFAAVSSCCYAPEGTSASNPSFPRHRGSPRLGQANALVADFPDYSIRITWHVTEESLLQWGQRNPTPN